MTRWTPGAGRDTPGFIGLGTFQGPSSPRVRASVHRWMHHLRYSSLRSYTRTWNFYPMGNPPQPTPPTATDIAMETEKQTLGVDAISTLCSELKVALMPFLHSLSALQLSSERYPAVADGKMHAHRRLANVWKYACLFSRIVDVATLRSFSVCRQDEKTFLLNPGCETNRALPALTIFTNPHQPCRRADVSITMAA